MRDVWITGIGLVSSLGEGLDTHWQRLTDADGPQPTIDSQSLDPFPIHPLAPVNFDEQIPKKGDQRQMEHWQRIGTYAAGLALHSAGLAGNSDLLGRTHMIVAAGGGERDPVVDGAVVTGLVSASGDEAGRILNERLSNDLRPTLFLAQLSNLLAGNISIVHGVTGSSRTFMGEEASGADALKVAFARLRAGQGDLALVGGSYNAARKDTTLLYAMGNKLWRGGHRPVWERVEAGGGFIPGSLGSFLVLEAGDHAQSRGARGFGRIVEVASDRVRRDAGEAVRSALRCWSEIAPHLGGGMIGVISGATGSEPATAEERAFIEQVGSERDLAVRATGTMLGHALEAQFPANVGLAALALSRRSFYPPFDRSGIERNASAPPRQIVVTGFGQWRGEALALVEAIG